MAQLVAAVDTAVPGDTILIADGTYDLNGAFLWVDTPGITLRSASGDRDAVILDGNFELADLGSTNGVYVNGHKVPKKTLVPGDIVRVGNTEMRFSRG